MTKHFFAHCLMLFLVLFAASPLTALASPAALETKPAKLETAAKSPIAAPTPTPLLSGEIVTYGELPPKVIYTPKNYNEKEYSELICPEKYDKVISPFDAYMAKRLNNQDIDGHTQYDIGAATKYSDLLYNFRAVDTVSEFNISYGYIISFKYRGEEQFQKDKAFLKKIINEYEGIPCKVLLSPERYSYDDLMRIKAPLDIVLKKYGRSESGYDRKRGGLYYLPTTVNEEETTIPEIEKYIEEKGYAPEVHVLRTGKGKDVRWDPSTDYEFQAEYEKWCGPWWQVQKRWPAT